MARNPTGIPLDDEPMDFDLGDLPTDEELEAAGETAPALAAGPGDAADEGGETSILGLVQLWVVLVSLAYVLIGVGIGALFAFRGAAGFGLAALAHPQFYLVVFFWPIAIWQLFFKQL